MNGMKAFGALKSCTGCLLLLMASSSSMTQSAASPASSAISQGTIYAASPAGPSRASAIFRLNNPSSLNGIVVPSATITGQLTLLDSPVISVDAPADRLFALVKMDGVGAILVFDHASSRNGNIFPERVIAGRNTGIQGTGIFAVDGARNLLYAGTRVTANGANILVFKNAAAATGNLPPDAVLQFSTSQIFPVSMVLDQVNDRLFIGDSSQNIRIFDHASMMTTGPMLPSRTIRDPNIILSGGMALDSAGRLLVGSRHNSTTPAHISIYDNAATANGVVSPVAIITGSGTALNLGGPGSLAVFNGPGASAGGDLYVSVESGVLLVFTNIATANGDMKPARTIWIRPQASVLSLAVDGSR